MGPGVPEAPPRRRTALAAVGLAVLGFVLYSGALGAFFHSDDFVLIHLVRQDGPRALWTHGPGGFFRPVVSASLFLDLQLWGLDPAGYHRTNVLLHCANACLVAVVAFLVLGIVRVTPHVWLFPGLAGLLFLVLPCHAEAVSWVSGRTDVVAAFFVLVSLVLYLLHGVGRSRVLLCASLGAFFLALCSKESAVSFPLVLAALELARRLVAPPAAGEPPRDRLAPVLAFFVLLGLYVCLRYRCLGTCVGGYGDAVHLDFDPRLLEKNLAKSLVKSLVPASVLTSLHVDGWSYWVFAPLGWLLAAVSLGVPVALWIPAVRRAAAPAAGTVCALVSVALPGACFIAATLPVITLSLPFPGPGGDRLVYLPSVFAVLLVTAVLARVRTGTALVVATLLVVLHAACLREVNDRWRRAGVVTRNLIDSLKGRSLANRRLIVITLPDSLDGAYVFRNGWTQALELFHGDARGVEPFVVSMCAPASPDLAVTVRTRGSLLRVRFEGSLYGRPQEPGKFWVIGVPSVDSDRPVAPAPGLVYRNAFYEASGIESHGFDLKLLEPGAGDTLVWYSRGTLAP